MAKITQDFINGLGYLYEEIQAKDTDFLNEESEYYDEELSELSEDIFLSIALSMFSEGYSAETFLKFLSSSEEEVILEKYLSTDVTLLSEEVVYTDFVEEQLTLLEAGRGQQIVNLLKSIRNLGKSGVTRAATAGVERRVGRQLLGRKGIDIAVPGSRTGRSGSSMDRTTAALEKLSKSKAQKAGINVPSGRLDARQSTELLKQARTAQAIKGVKSAATGALLTGLGVLGGYTGAKLAGGGSGGGAGGEGSPDGGKQPAGGDKARWNAAAALGGQAAFKAGGGVAKMKQNPQMTAADVQKQGMINIRNKKATAPAAPAATPPAAPAATPPAAAPSGGGGGGAGGGKQPSTPPKPVKPTDGAERRTPTSAELRDAQQARQNALAAGKSKEEAEKAAVQAGIDRGTKLMGGPEGPGQIDVKDVEASIKAEQERQRKRAEQKATQTAGTTTTTTTTAKESYDAYDVILEYLMNTEQAETLDEAHYLMLEMDQSAIVNIMEEYENYLISEEIYEWVNSLLSEGYDLSAYTWDGIVEYYLNEAHYGTAKGRKKLAKKVRAGEDVGKKGGGFEEIVSKATPKYGKERAKKIAAAAMWKNLGK